LRGDIREFVEKCFKEVAENNDFEIEAMEIAEDHVHIFLGFATTLCEIRWRLTKS